MSKKATEFQKKEMSKMYRGKEIFKPLNTGWLDDNVACVREWVANIFFYRKNGKTIMIENKYLTGEKRRKVIYKLYKLPQVTVNNQKVLLKDGEKFKIGDINIEAFMVPGHTWGHMVYLIDDKYLFTGDTIWFGADGGYSFISALAENNKLAVKSLAEFEKKLKARGLKPIFITGHTGYTDDFEFAFAHKDKLCSPFKKKVHDPSASYDAYDESDDTEEKAKNVRLQPVKTKI